MSDYAKKELGLNLINSFLYSKEAKSLLRYHGHGPFSLLYLRKRIYY